MYYTLQGRVGLHSLQLGRANTLPLTVHGHDQGEWSRLSKGLIELWQSRFIFHESRTVNLSNVLVTTVTLIALTLQQKSMIIGCTVERGLYG